MPISNLDSILKTIQNILHTATWSQCVGGSMTYFTHDEYIVHQDIVSPRYITIGGFDGVHVGHQKIIQTMHQKVSDSFDKSSNFDFKTRVLVITFDPLPKQFFHPELQPLTSLSTRIELLHRYGADEVLTLPFSNELRSLTALDFLRYILIDALDMKVLFLGEDHSFGKGGEGDLNFVQKWQDTFGYSVHYIQPHLESGKKVSATDLRMLRSNV